MIGIGASLALTGGRDWHDSRTPWFAPSAVI